MARRPGERRFERSGVYRRGGIWLSVFVGYGGGSKQAPHATRAAAEAELRADMDAERQSWEGKVERARRDPRRDPAVVVIDAHYYRIGPEGGSRINPNGRPRFGYAGREFRIRKHDDTEIVTNNLWSGGRVPPEFRNSLPDTARFVGPSP